MDRLNAIALGGSLVLNILIWGVFSPGLFIPLGDFFVSDTLYLGRVGGVAPVMDMPFVKAKRMGIDKWLIREVELKRDKTVSYKVWRVMYDIPEPMVGKEKKHSFDIQKTSFGRRSGHSIFYRGTVRRFPDGKRYHFCPKYLYPNVYKMMLFSRYMEFGYD